MRDYSRSKREHAYLSDIEPIHALLKRLHHGRSRSRKFSLKMRSRNRHRRVGRNVWESAILPTSKSISYKTLQKQIERTHCGTAPEGRTNTVVSCPCLRLKYVGCRHALPQKYLGEADVGREYQLPAAYSGCMVHCQQGGHVRLSRFVDALMKSSCGAQSESHSSV